jgi:hypothetical protein
MPVKVPKKQRKLGLLPGVLNNNGFHGSYSWHVSQGSGDKGMFDGTDAASMDSEMGLPVLFTYRLINGINAFILFFGYTFYRR